MERITQKDESIPAFFRYNEQAILEQQQKISHLDDDLNTKIQKLCKLDAAKRMLMALISKLRGQNILHSESAHIDPKTEDFHLEDEKEKVHQGNFSYLTNKFRQYDPDKLQFYPFSDMAVPKSILERRQAMVNYSKVEATFSITPLPSPYVPQSSIQTALPKNIRTLFPPPPSGHSVQVPPQGYVSTLFTRRGDAPRQPFLGHTGDGELIFPRPLSHIDITRLKPGTLLWVLFGLSSALTFILTLSIHLSV